MARILFTGGGTGGHVYPLIAVARALRRIQPDVALYFVGSTSFGKKDLLAEGIAVYGVAAGKFRRYADIRSVLDSIKAPLGFLQALGILFWIMPDVIFSKGGYGSVPVVLAGRVFRIPVIIHESDSVSGLANAWLGRFAHAILIAFPEAAKQFRAKDQKRIFLVGNPVWVERTEGAKTEARTIFSLRSDRPVLAVMGGSQGAERLNDLLIRSLPDLAADYEIIHQTGLDHIEKVKEEALRVIPPEQTASWHPMGFLDAQELRAFYAAADCIISRAGAGAVFEIAAAGKPSILIPLDRGSRGEQIKNAYAYARLGAAIVLEENNLSPNIFVKTIRDLMADTELRNKMSEAAKKFATPEAAERIAETILSSL